LTHATWDTMGKSAGNRKIFESRIKNDDFGTNDWSLEQALYSLSNLLDDPSSQSDARRGVDPANDARPAMASSLDTGDNVQSNAAVNTKNPIVVKRLLGERVTPSSRSAPGPVSSKHLPNTCSDEDDDHAGASPGIFDQTTWNGGELWKSIGDVGDSAMNFKPMDSVKKMGESASKMGESALNFKPVVSMKQLGESASKLGESAMSFKPVASMKQLGESASKLGESAMSFNPARNSLDLIPKTNLFGGLAEAPSVKELSKKEDGTEAQADEVAPQEMAYSKSLSGEVVLASKWRDNKGIMKSDDRAASRSQSDQIDAPGKGLDVHSESPAGQGPPANRNHNVHNGWEGAVGKGVDDAGKAYEDGMERNSMEMIAPTSLGKLGSNIENFGAEIGNGFSSLGGNLQSALGLQSNEPANTLQFLLTGSPMPPKPIQKGRIRVPSSPLSAPPAAMSDARAVTSENRKHPAPAKSLVDGKRKGGDLRGLLKETTVILKELHELILAIATEGASLSTLKEISIDNLEVARAQVNSEQIKTAGESILLGALAPTQDIESLCVEVETLCTQLERARKDVSKERQRREEAEDILRQVKKTLENQIAAEKLREEEGAKKISEIQGKLDHQIQVRKSLEDELERSKTLISTTDEAASCNATKSASPDLVSDLEIVSTPCTKVNVEDGDEMRLKQQLEDQKKEVLILKGEIENLKESLTSSETENAILRSRLDALNASVDGQDSTILVPGESRSHVTGGNLEAERKTWEKEKGDMQEQIQNLLKACMEEEREAEMARKREASLRDQLSRLNASLARVRSPGGNGDNGSRELAQSPTPLILSTTPQQSGRNDPTLMGVSESNDPVLMGAEDMEGTDWQLTPEAHMRRAGKNGGSYVQSHVAGIKSLFETAKMQKSGGKAKEKEDERRESEKKEQEVMDQMSGVKAKDTIEEKEAVGKAISAEDSG
jgi:hypothetical protein